MKTSKEKELWDLVEKSKEFDLNGVGIHEGEFMYPDFEYRIYTSNGWCLDIRKEHQCEPEEIEDHDIYQLHDDGCTYSFSSWVEEDGFKDASIDEVLDFFKNLMFNKE